MKLIFTGLIILITVSLNNKYTQNNSLKESIKRGGNIYTDFCMQCHLTDGKGVENTYPPLAKSDYLIKNREASIRGIKFGQQGKITVNGTTYNNVMTPMGLSDEEIADVMNYITNTWGNKNEKMVTEKEVSSIKKQK